MRALGFWTWSLVAVSVYAGGSPLRTAVVVNRSSAQSLELGRYYAERRGIPDHHIIPITTFVSNNIALASYSNDIEGPVRAYINSNGLSNQIDQVVFSMDIPYRVYLPPFTDNRFSGLTATFYYGFFSSPNAFASGCDLAVNSVNPYFERETAFSRAASYSSNRLYLAAMLTASGLPVAKRLVDRAVVADGSFPPSSVLMMRTTDNRRNVQWEEFENTEFLGRFIGEPSARERFDADFVVARTNIIGFSFGVPNPTWLGLNTSLPGAFGSHLTSFGGFLFEDSGGQMPIIGWIENGYAGSYGTVVEPCAYTNKFVSPRFHYWYARGFSLGESLWMSVRNPYQGIVVGDPLCAPFSEPPAVEWIGVTNGMLLSGTASLTGRIDAVSALAPIARIAWYLDARKQADLVQHGPVSGEVVTVEVNGSPRNYTVGPGDTVTDIAAGLAASINANPPLPVTAKASGDRVLLRQVAAGASAAGWTIAGSVTPGTSGVASVHLQIPTTNFMETTIAARELLTLSGNALSGDVVRAAITRLDGGVFTNTYTVTTNFASPLSILNGLAALINSDANLQDVRGCLGTYARQFNSSLTRTNAELWLFARTNTWEGHNLVVQYDIIPNSTSTLDAGESFTGNFDDNGDNLRARATVFVSAGVTQAWPVLAADTTSWADGPHTLTLVAHDGTGVEAEGRAEVSVVVDNHDVTCSITSPPDRVYRLGNGAVTVHVAAATSLGSVTQVVVFAEGKAMATGLTAVVALADYGAGPLRLQAQAWATGGRSTLSLPVTLMLYTDADGDGMSDQWEYQSFGAFTNFGGSSDADGDGVPNHDEFYADTQPTNASSYLYVQEMSSAASVSFMASADRLYRLRFNEGDLMTAAWIPDGVFFRGGGGVTNIFFAATNNALFILVEPKLPE